MFVKRVWIPILIVLITVIGCSLFYSQKTAKQDPVTIILPAETEQPTEPKPPPPGETYEPGHWHGDHWHSVVNEPIEAPAAEFTEAQGAPIENPPRANTQIVEQAAQEGKIKLFSKGTPEYLQAVKKWQAWEEKAHEIRLEIGAVAKEHVDALALTEAEAERYETDENIQRKVARRVNAVTEKLNDVYRRQREHEEKRPPFPYLQ